MKIKCSDVRAPLLRKKEVNIISMPGKGLLIMHFISLPWKPWVTNSQNTNRVQWKSVVWCISFQVEMPTFHWNQLLSFSLIINYGLYRPIKAQSPKDVNCINIRFWFLPVGDNMEPVDNESEVPRASSAQSSIAGDTRSGETSQSSTPSPQIDANNLAQAESKSTEPNVQCWSYNSKLHSMILELSAVKY